MKEIALQFTYILPVSSFLDSFFLLCVFFLFFLLQPFHFRYFYTIRFEIFLSLCGCCLLSVTLILPFVWHSVDSIFFSTLKKNANEKTNFRLHQTHKNLTFIKVTFLQSYFHVNWLGLASVHHKAMGFVHFASTKLSPLHKNG